MADEVQSKSPVHGAHEDSDDASNASESESHVDDANGGPATKRQRTEQEKRMDRVLANRRSARESRERKKRLQGKLEASVAFLTKENSDLVRENETLRTQLNLMKERHNRKRFMLGTTTPQAPSGIHPMMGVNAYGMDRMQQLQMIQQLPQYNAHLTDDVLKTSLG